MEGWSFIDRLSAETVCNKASNPNHHRDPLTNVIHYCQIYHLGDWFFSKYKLTPNFFSCECPLLAFPPAEIGYFNYTVSSKGEKKSSDEEHSKREAYMLCGIVFLLNEASLFFKSGYCEKCLFTTYDKTLRIFVGWPFLGSSTKAFAVKPLRLYSVLTLAVSFKLSNRVVIPSLFWENHPVFSSCDSRTMHSKNTT